MGGGAGEDRRLASGGRAAGDHLLPLAAAHLAVGDAGQRPRPHCAGLRSDGVLMLGYDSPAVL